MKRLLVLLMGAALMLSACASPRATWVTATEAFIASGERFIAAAERQDPVTRAEWKAKMLPKFEAANSALDAWGEAIELESAYASQEKARFQDAMDGLIDALFGIYRVAYGEEGRTQ